MYLSDWEIDELERKFKKSNKIFGILAGFFLIGVLAAIFPSEGQEFDPGMAAFSGSLMAGCILKILLNICKYGKFKDARRINNIFENDSDGMMSFTELANALHLPKDKVEKSVLWMLNKGVLKNIRFSDKDPNTIVLRDVNVAETNRFITFNCQSCGAMIQVRSGQAVTCPSCGSIVAPELKDIEK